MLLTVVSLPAVRGRLRSLRRLATIALFGVVGRFGSIPKHCVACASFDLEEGSPLSQTGREGV